jgi:hypothetical protein
MLADHFSTEVGVCWVSSCSVGTTPQQLTPNCRDPRFFLSFLLPILTSPPYLAYCTFVIILGLTHLDDLVYLSPV